MAFGGIAGSRKLRCAVGFAALLAVLSGCAERDADHVQSRKDFDRLIDRAPPPAAAETSPPPIPALQPIIAAPPPPGVSQRLVSLSVTDPNISVREVLLELARKVGADIDLDPKVEGGVIISAHERPFIDVVNRICEQDELRCSFKDNVLKVVPDTAHYETYHLDLLTQQRTLSSEIANSLSISSLIQGSGGGGGQNTSTTDVKATSSYDVWKDIDDNVKAILANSDPAGTAAGVAAALPPPSAVAPAPAPASVPAAGAAGVPGGVLGTAQAIAGATAAAGAPDGVAAQPAAAAASSAPAAGSASTITRYSINKEAGILSVFGTDKQQRLIQAYLEKVLAKIGTQVLIEAKVVEISLWDQYNTGVDWQALRQNLKGTGFGLSSLEPGANTLTALPGLPKPGNLQSPFGQFGLNAGFTTFGGDLAAMVNLVKTYGDVRTLSSPRLTVANNQPATLKVAQNHVYFKLTATVTSTPATVGSAASQTATYNSQLQTLPIGLVMTVMPTIDPERGLITLGLRPSVTAWPGTTVSDPAVGLSIATACGGSISGACSPDNVATAVASASVPVVNIREMESVVTVPSGAVVVLGGLMQQINSKQDSGVPGAADVPVVGNLFKANSDQIQLTELVIFLKATLVRGPETIDWADKNLYKDYFHDPRPTAF